MAGIKVKSNSKNWVPTTRPPRFTCLWMSKEKKNKNRTRLSCDRQFIRRVLASMTWTSLIALGVFQSFISLLNAWQIYTVQATKIFVPYTYYMPGNAPDTGDTMKMNTVDRIHALKEFHSTGEGRQWAETHTDKDEMVLDQIAVV